MTDLINRSDALKANIIETSTGKVVLSENVAAGALVKVS